MLSNKPAKQKASYIAFDLYMIPYYSAIVNKDIDNN